MKANRNNAPAILLLIALFFLSGLENIMLPPLDAHGWRQSLTLSIAHNFLEHPNILYPRMDIGGETEGIISCEFPLYNYLLAGIFKVFGPHDWYGRLLNWTIACAGLWFFYELVRKSLNPRAAFFATLTLMCSILFEYARKSMPDTFAISLTVAGIWSALEYLEKGRSKFLVASFLLVTFGGLSKIPAIIALSFLWMPLSDKSYPTLLKKRLTLTLATGISLVLAWYFVWMPYLLETYKNQLIFPVSFREGWKIIMEQREGEAWDTTVKGVFYYKLPFLFALMGLGALLAGNDSRFKWFALTYLAAFFAFALKTGIVFPTHEYYSIPLALLWAFAMGYFLDQLRWSPLWSGTLALVLLLPSYLYYKQRSFTPDHARRYLQRLNPLMERFTRPEDKIMVNDGSFNPTMMYWAKRKGWTVNQDVPGQTTWMPGYKKQGLKYIVLDRHLQDDTLPYALVYEDEHFRLYQP